MPNVDIILYDKAGGGKTKINKTPTGKKTYSGIFRKELDIRTPIIEIEDTSTEIKDKRYAKIERYYYFVKDIVIDHNDYHIITLEIDYLMSFKEDIKNIVVLSTRASGRSAYTPDPRMLMTTKKEITQINATSSLSATYGKQLFIRTASHPGTTLFVSRTPGSNIYAVDTGELVVLLNKLYDDTLVEQINKKIFNVSMDAILDYYELPFTGSGLSIINDYIALGTATGGIATMIYSEYATISRQISIPAHFNDFRDHAPYTEIEFYAPGIGWIPLDPALVVGGLVTIIYKTSVITGDSNVEIRNASGVTIYSEMINLARHHPLKVDAVQSTSLVKANAVMMSIPTVVGAAGGTLLGNPVAGAAIGAGVGNVLGSALGSDPTSISVSGGGGSNAFIDSMPKVKITRLVPYDSSEYFTEFGAVSSKVKTIGDYNDGEYIAIGELDTSTCDTPYNDEITAVLSQGVRM